MRDVDSDRGAETYDYVLAQKMALETRSRNFDDRERQQRSMLDRDLDDYFTNSRSRSTSGEGGEDGEVKGEADGGEDDMDQSGDLRNKLNSNISGAGKKRSARERSRHNRHHHGNSARGGGNYPHHSNFHQLDEDLSIPQPGVPRTIPDLDLAEVKERMASSGEEMTEVADWESTLGNEIGNKLSEPKTELMVGVVKIVGMYCIFCKRLSGI